MGSRQREVPRHAARSRGEIRQRRRATGNLDSSAAGAGRRAGRVAAARAIARFSIPPFPKCAQKVADDIARLREWGFELIKHDYTTYDIFGRWGFQMGAALTRDGWTFASGPTRTTAEVIDDLYRTIRDGRRR